LSPGAVRGGTFATAVRVLGFERGAEERADVRAAVALVLAFAGRRAALFLAVALAALRGAFLADRRALATVVFFAVRLRLAALRDADRPRAAPRRALAPFRRVARAGLRLAISGSFREQILH